MKLFINHFEKLTFETLFSEYKNLDFSLFIDYRPQKTEEFSSVNIIVLQEPNEYFGHHDWVIQNQHLFSFIFSFSNLFFSLNV